MKTTAHDATARRDFNMKVTARLAALGIRLLERTLAPGDDGSFANGVNLYSVDDNGTGKMLTRADVLALAA